MVKRFRDAEAKAFLLAYAFAAAVVVIFAVRSAPAEARDADDEATTASQDDLAGPLSMACPTWRCEPVLACSTHAKSASVSAQIGFCFIGRSSIDARKVSAQGAVEAARAGHQGCDH